MSNPYFLTHLCVLLWGFTAVLGRLISLDAIPLVFWRVSLVALGLMLWRPMWRTLIRMSRGEIALCAGGGVVVMTHWLCFFGAIKLANASIAATSIALTPVFLSIIEPLLMRRPFIARDLLIAIAAVPGVVLVMGGIPSGMFAGFALGVASAVLLAVFSLINKHLAMRVPALPLTAIEMSAGAVSLGLLIPLWPWLGTGFIWPQPMDLFWLLALSFGCTLLPFLLSLHALRKLSAFSVQLAVNLEPVYTIAIAALLFGENRELRWPFYAGLLLILGGVVAHTWLLKRVAPRP